MKKVLMISSLIFAMILTACGGEEAAVNDTEIATGKEETAVVSNEATKLVSNEDTSKENGNNAVVLTSDSVSLNEEYNDALPVQSQLAIGILQLENGDNAVDETLAAELLPLWRAVQSLANSETAADAEVTAVLNQIQETLSAEQIAAISAMQLTDESFQAMMAEGTISTRGGFGGNRDGGAGTGDGGGRPAGGPGGPGGLPGGGGNGPGGGGGALGGDPGAIETRMAERGIEGAMEGLQANAMTTSAVIRLLEGKTGEVSERALGGGMMGAAITAVSEATNLSVEEVQAALAEGKTLADIIAENGGDLEAIEAALVESVTGSDFLQDQDPAEFVSGLLTGENGRSGTE